MDRLDAHLRVNAQLHDPVALAEIELYSELLTAVAAAEHHLSLAEIDRILGVRPVRSGPGEGAASAGSTALAPAAARPTQAPLPSRCAARE